jgi:molybdopterin-guanine dinucleotide biosynthesis protein B
MKAIGVVGYHHTGKTTLATLLISALSGKGFEVASIKDIHSEKYRADKEGSNSWKHAQAGANQVFARGLKDGALILTPSPDLRQILGLIRADWLVIEGLRDAAVPKIVCADSLAQADELFDPTVIAYSGKISGQTDSHNGLPVLSALSKGEELLSLVLAKAFPILPQSDPDCCSACGRNCYQLAGEILQGLAKREDCVLDGKSDLILEVGGSAVTIVPFVQKLLRDSVLAFVDNLKDIPPMGDISIKVRR